MRLLLFRDCVAGREHSFFGVHVIEFFRETLFYDQNSPVNLLNLAEIN
jgi:hypothetical protein